MPHERIGRCVNISTGAQVMVCCVMAPSHYLNQCWLIINGFCGIQIRTIFLVNIDSGNNSHQAIAWTNIDWISVFIGSVSITCTKPLNPTMHLSHIPQSLAHNTSHWKRNVHSSVMYSEVWNKCMVWFVGLVYSMGFIVFVLMLLFHSCVLSWKIKPILALNESSRWGVSVFERMPLKWACRLHYP